MVQPAFKVVKSGRMRNLIEGAEFIRRDMRGGLCVDLAKSEQLA
jgi:hypothetical protein